MLNNTPWQDDNFGIEKRPAKSILRYNVRMHGELFGIWEHNNIIYVSKKYNPEYLTFAGLKSLKEDDVPIRKNEGVHKLLTTMLDLGAVKFESIPVREMVYEIINGGFKTA